jgi:autotransporter-associated beta strand protein
MKKSRLFLMVLALVAVCATSQAGLISLYEFEEGSGTTAANSVTGQQAGTMVGAATWGAGMIGNGAYSNPSSPWDPSIGYLNMNGSSVYTNDALAVNAGAFWTGTWSVWVNPGELQSEPGLYWVNYAGGVRFSWEQTDYNIMKLECISDGSYINRVYGSPAEDGTWYDILQDGNWHLLTFTYNLTTGDASTGTSQLYLDGALADTGFAENLVTSGLSFGAKSSHVWFTTNTGLAEESWLGLSDDLANWNTQLSDTEAMALNNLGRDTLNYGAKNATALFDLYATGGSAVVGGQTWIKVNSGLTGDLGAVVGSNTLILGGEEGNRSGVQIGLPVAADVTWTGATSTTWSTATGSGNWKKTSDNSAADYANGVAVLFNDTASGLTADISVADVSPSSVTFNNSTNNFTVTGSKGIAGSTGILKQGTGKVTLSSVNSYTGVTTVDGLGGTLQLNGVTKAQAPVLTGGGANIKAGKMVFDYTGEGSPAATIKGLLTTSYHVGAWDTGKFKSSTADANKGLGWVDNTATSQVLVAQTLYGDSTVNGKVDLSDLAALGANWNATGKVWSQGDFNYDGKVDLSDLAALGAHWNQSIAGFSAALDSATVVPEPGTLALLAAGLMGLLAYAWRKRK